LPAHPGNGAVNRLACPGRGAESLGASLGQKSRIDCAMPERSPFEAATGTGHRCAENAATRSYRLCVVRHSICLSYRVRGPACGGRLPTSACIKGGQKGITGCDAFARFAAASTGRLAGMRRGARQCQ